MRWQAANTASSIALLELFNTSNDLERIGVKNARVVEGDIFDSCLAEGKYSLIVSNPPYIPKSEMSEISPETKFEPETALLASDNGLEFYKAIINNYKESLENGGMLCFEVGINESKAVSNLLSDANFENITVKKDLNGIERVVSAIKI